MNFYKIPKWLEKEANPLKYFQNGRIELDHSTDEDGEVEVLPLPEKSAWAGEADEKTRETLEKAIIYGSGKQSGGF
ncbi:MAG: hypothetical protein Q4F00_10265 [bacterium]|nr:hypothetical protein [bacterium]